MISEKMQELLNAQLNREYYSSYLYLAMSAHCDSLSLVGFAHWLRVQSQEELGHALKFFDYICQQRGRVVLGKIDPAPSEFGEVQEVFQRALKHEQLISKSINDLYAFAEQEKDYATRTLLSWFVTEQVEEEAEAALMVDRLAMAGASKGSLLYLDKEAKKRQPQT